MQTKSAHGERWEKLPDGALCEAVKEMESGLIDASLGGFLYKKRVARVGGGKSGGHCSSRARCSSTCRLRVWPGRWQSVFCWRCIVASKITESLRDDLAALHEAGAISKVTMREFDVICPPPVREFSAGDIKRLRQALKFSQPVFAHHLHTTASTVRKWEQGDTRPAGPALKLLNVIADKGLQAIL